MVQFGVNVPAAKIYGVALAGPASGLGCRPVPEKVADYFLALWFV